MDPITTSTLCISSIGLVSAAALAVADKFLSIPEDPRVGKVLECLPGVNCGGCGFAGCGDYARAIVQHGAEPTLCAPGGSACAQAIALVMGCAGCGEREKMVALVMCNGTRSEALTRATYNGIADCVAAQAVAGGDKACTYGCLGYASCARVCPVHAITIQDGIAKVDKQTCISCGKCVATCPRKLIKMVPVKAEVHVLCSNKDKGALVKKVCGVGCIGCKMCTKHGGEAFVVTGFLSARDYTKEIANPEEVIAKCPGKCIRKV